MISDTTQKRIKAFIENLAYPEDTYIELLYGKPTTIGFWYSSDDWAEGNRPDFTIDLRKLIKDKYPNVRRPKPTGVQPGLTELIASTKLYRETHTKNKEDK